MFYQKFIFGNTAIYYVETPVEGRAGATTVGLCAYPKEWDVQHEKLRLDSLVQVAFSGDEAILDYSNGVTMICHSSTLLHVEKQTATEHSVITLLSDGAGNFYTHTLCYEGESGVFSVQAEYENRSNEVRTLEKLASFSLSGLCALSQGGNNTCGLKLHRMTSAWSRECRLQSLPFSALGQEMSWARYGVKCERWGQIGSMSNRGYYPFAAVEDSDAEVVWGVQMETPYSWQLELCGEKECCTLSGGLADYECGHWRKRISPNEKFATHKAYFTVQTSLNGVCNALVHAADKRLCVPESEEELPVLFNEYCTTWGNPCVENIRAILAAIEGLPISYFVIDCGWFKPLDRHWSNAIGDWNVNGEMFPEGLPALVREINAAGMKAGIWFEYELSGRDSANFYRENLHLHRDGSVITSKNRRFLDLRLNEVRQYLQEKVLDQLRESGFEYIKIDYNDAYGIGCDGAESFGEGGRQVAEKSIAFLDAIKATVPEIVIENCASGGSRIEPLRMNAVSMCSFSDAHECVEIPLIAANVSRAIPARQMQIWAVLRKSDDDNRTVYSLCAAMLGRICLSGDVLHLGKEKKELVKSGLIFYNGIKDIVRYGDIVSIDCNVEYYREPVGRQICIKEYQGRRLVIVHRLLSQEPVTVEIKGYRLIDAFTCSRYFVQDDRLILEGGTFEAGAFLLKKDE